mmetsp:Transcript_19140/g.32774  ORF Transcript_19140/g.32774 Transcript_19140/m.32774 type:complete len:396 (-) Transcript_19140:229-1416(-)
MSRAFSLALMNDSNNNPQDAPERVDMRLNPRPLAADARMEGAAASPAAKPKSGPGKEMTAASALTSLVKSPNMDDSNDDEDFEIPQRFTKSGRKKATPFPMKLMKVLCQKEFNDIIAWLPDGKSFTILRPKAFVNEILPQFFKSAKYSSFTRKLHRWGFQRHLRGEEAGAFFHKLFQRGRLDLVEKMTCYKPDTRPTMLGKPQAVPSFREPLLSRQIRTGMAQQAQLPHGPLESQLMQEQMRSQLQQQSPQLQMQQMQQQIEPLDSVGRLNAAIEIEVNRRLKERITAAAISRQALSMMQQQVPQVDPRMSQLNTIAGMNMNPAGLNANMNMGNNFNWNTSAAAAAGAQPMMPVGLNHLNVGKGLTSGGCNPDFGDFSSLLGDVSHRNIQGAKTA